MYLFIDTTENITVGILDKNFEWLSYTYLENKKSSSEIHYLINNKLDEFNLKITNISGVFYSAGPGSYTGMRVSEGIVRILEWHNLKIFSFYHYEIPQLIGIEKGTWLSKAFKGELFVYKWAEGKGSWTLVLEGEFDLDKHDCVYFGHHKLYDMPAQLTKELINKKSQIVFRSILNLDEKKDIFYYRTLSEEYGVKS